MDILNLNQKYAKSNLLRFETGEGNLPLVKIENSNATAVISLYGAHVMSYIPKNGQEVLWMSPVSYFEEGQPIRGGIPVCFPWFGPNACDPSKPMHGFARLSIWKVIDTVAEGNEVTSIKLLLESDENTLKMWDVKFQATMTISVGKVLTVSLYFTNLDNREVKVSEALHTYLKISETSAVTIEGLMGTTYLDGLKGNSYDVQKEKLLPIEQEENRRYIDTDTTCILHDQKMKRNISVSKTGSLSTVVWNPWKKTILGMKDMPKDGYKTMVCIEAANAFDNTLTVLPGASHELSTTLSVEPTE